jgi:hypothetical protein
MANQLIPPLGLESSVPDSLTMEERAALWFDSMSTALDFLLAGLRREIGPNGDLRAAYCRWYAERMQEHDQAIRQLADNMYRHGVRHGQ